MHHIASTQIVSMHIADFMHRICFSLSPHFDHHHLKLLRSHASPFIPLLVSCAKQPTKRNKTIYLHRSRPLFKTGLDRPENRYGRYGLLVFQHFQIYYYNRGGWSQSFPLKILLSCRLSVVVDIFSSLQATGLTK